MIILILLFGFTVLVTSYYYPQSSGVDNYGHIGGLLVGLIAGMCVGKLEDELQPAGLPFPNRSRREKYLKVISTATLSTLFLVGFTCFFAARNPKP